MVGISKPYKLTVSTKGEETGHATTNLARLDKASGSKLSNISAALAKKTLPSDDHISMSKVKKIGILTTLPKAKRKNGKIHLPKLKAMAYNHLNLPNARKPGRKDHKKLPDKKITALAVKGHLRKVKARTIVKKGHKTAVTHHSEYGIGR